MTRSATSKRFKNVSWESVKDFFNIGKIKRGFTLGADIAAAAQPFVSEPSPLTGVVAAFAVAKVIVDDCQVWADDYFEGDTWARPYPNEFTAILMDALAGHPRQVIRTSEESAVIHVVTIEDVKFGYVVNLKMNTVDYVRVKADQVDAARKIVKRILWSKLKNDNVVLRSANTKKFSLVEGCPIVMRVDDDFKPLASKRATEYSTYLKRCVESDVPRSILLHGPPGTGKSTMARTIVNALGMKSFRIRVEDIDNIDPPLVYEALDIFEPDAVILDDFDKSTSQAALLEMLVHFQRHVKFVVATVNDRSRLDDAILRPERFDEIVEVKAMDRDVVLAVLGEANVDAIDAVAEWPIAFVKELVKRRRFMTKEEAEASTRELADRVKRMNDRYDAREASLDVVSRPKPAKKAKKAGHGLRMSK